MILKKINLESAHELLIITADFFLPFLKLGDPGKILGRRRRSRLSAEKEIAPIPLFFFGIHPMGGDAELCFCIHFFGSDLDFEYPPFGAKDGGME